jgi:hypothetical protein
MGLVSEPAQNSHISPIGQLELLRADFDRLRGRLYELVECTGMAADQADAFKRLIRRQSYDTQSRLEDQIQEMMK